MQFLYKLKKTFFIFFILLTLNVNYIYATSINGSVLLPGSDSVNSNASSSISEQTSIPNVYSPACILMDQNSGKILYSKNANTRMYPASTTKIMTE